MHYGGLLLENWRDSDKHLAGPSATSPISFRLSKVTRWVLQRSYACGSSCLISQCTSTTSYLVSLVPSVLKYAKEGDGIARNSEVWTSCAARMFSTDHIARWWTRSKCVANVEMSTGAFSCNVCHVLHCPCHQMAVVSDPIKCVGRMQSDKTWTKAGALMRYWLSALMFTLLPV